MNLKKIELTLDYGEGEVTETRFFDINETDENITTLLLAGEYSYGPVPTINFVGEVDAANTLGEDFKEIGGQYYTFEEWQAIMTDMMEGVCPGGQGYDK